MNTDAQLDLSAHLDRIETANASARSALVDEFMHQVARLGTPLVLNATTAAFVYRGPGEHVRLIGDMTNWSSESTLDRVSDTDLFVYFGAFPSDARLEYQLLIDDEALPDPTCPDRVLHGLGASSELAMPDYQRRPVFEPVRDGTTGTYGRVRRLEVPAGILGYAKEVHVYTPQGHDQADAERRYPTIYILDGRDYIEYAHTPAVLDHLIAGEQVQPLIAVFVSPPNRHQPEQPNRTTEYGLNPQYARFIVEELVPLIDARYRTHDGPSARLIVGDSYAGLAAAYISFQHADAFGLGYSQSGYLSLNSDALIKSYTAAERRPIRLYVDIGYYERTVGWEWIPAPEMDFLAANRRFRAVLESRGYDFQYREYPEGHTWGNWRAHLMDALEHFFGMARASCSNI